MNGANEILYGTIAVFVVVYVLYAGDCIRYGFGGTRGQVPSGRRVLIIRTVLATICLGIVGLIGMRDHVIFAAALVLLFTSIGWMSQRESIADESDTMSRFYSALHRVDVAGSRQAFGNGPVARWANALRESDYRALAGDIARESNRSDARADEMLITAYARRRRDS